MYRWVEINYHEKKKKKKRNWEWEKEREWAKKKNMYRRLLPWSWIGYQSDLVDPMSHSIVFLTSIKKTINGNDSAC